ncbi:MAG: Smr/MutS family protein, partial [Fimbriimonadales bacterium]|nr:Smr/MutS family protein [Fimbriimonadales bacterium]
AAMPSAWEVGMRVRIRSLGQTGTLAELPDGNQAQVYVGKLRIPVALSDLEPLDKPAPSKPAVRVSKPRPAQPVPLELDLHGLRVEEAQPLLEKYIDDALLAGYDSVRIQHGKGTGALRTMVWSYLKTHPHVRSFHHASSTEGGEGVTVVNFKKR